MKKAGTIKFEENWKFTLKDSFTGEVLSVKEFKNTITNAWKKNVQNWLFDNSGTRPVALAIGTGNTAATASDTSLETEFQRETATISKPGNYQIKYSKDFIFTSGTTANIVEAALFDSIISSGSLMTSRTTFAIIAIDSGTTLTVEATLTISA